METISGVCGAASLADKQYYFVKLHTDGTVIVCSGVTDHPIGVLQNKPEIGEACTIAVSGETLINADAAMALNATVGTAADGQGATYTGSDTTKYGMGICIRAVSNAGELAKILLRPVGLLT